MNNFRISKNISKQIIKHIKNKTNKTHIQTFLFFKDPGPYFPGRGRDPGSRIPDLGSRAGIRGRGQDHGVDCNGNKSWQEIEKMAVDFD